MKHIKISYAEGKEPHLFSLLYKLVKLQLERLPEVLQGFKFSDATLTCSTFIPNIFLLHFLIHMG